MKPLWPEIFTQIDKEIAFQAISYSREKILILTPALRMLMKKKGGSIVCFRTNDLVLSSLRTAEVFFALFDAVLPGTTLNQLLVPLYFESFEDNAQYREITAALEARPGAALCAFAGLGIFAWGETKTAADLRMNLFLHLVKVNRYLHLHPHFDPVPVITGLAEECGSALSALQPATGALAARIAVVTGAAQGLGEGIAGALAAAGAYVVLADINAEAAAAGAQAFNSLYGRGRAIAVKTDVTDEAQVRTLIEAAVAAYGGLDLFVSNAGILKAGSLDDLTLADFMLATQVNYTAFFLCTKYALVPMKIQSRFAPGYAMDIIQINSKSGLAGSKKNFAYAGSKFGSIGLIQSFALELVEYNIKVNAVCPGNFFEGPLWSHPEKGLFVQYLKAGKVPGAAAVGDVRRYYENQVPMKRGCRVADVVKAIFYIIDQEYETGQAIPVTGGQIMLK